MPAFPKVHAPFTLSSTLVCHTHNGENRPFCREPELPEVKFAVTNYGVSVGVQAVGAMLDRVDRLDRFFASYRSGDEYDTNAITQVMACSSAFPGGLHTAGSLSPTASRR